MKSYDRRAGELLALAIAEGIDLPMPVDEIVRLEDEGGVVDLASGEVWRNVKIAAMPALEALVVIDAMERQHGKS